MTTTPKKKGRPPLVDPQPRARFEVYLTEEQKAKLDAIARARSVPMSRVIHDWIDEAPEPSR
jgi:hypothetical protein